MTDAISLYCGGGGIEEGLKQANIHVKLAIDYEKSMCDTIKLNHPDTEVIHGSVGHYANSLPKTDVVVGGPPCPQFSRANTERTFDDGEVKNFWKIIRELSYKTEVPESVLKTIRDITDISLQAYSSQNKIATDTSEATKQAFKTFNQNTKSFATLNKEIMGYIMSVFEQKLNT